MTKRYRLGLSPDYVEHWGRWEAVRELLQNAYDQRDVSGCEVEVGLNDRGTLRIGTSDGELPRRSLLLGESTKRGDEDGVVTRGQFGEGYKLAMLVLTRMGHRVVVYNNWWRWEAQLVWDDDFECKVLEIVEEPLTVEEPGVTFLVEDFGVAGWEEVSRNVIEDGRVGVLEEPEEQGRVYVGGLFVCEGEGLRYGYSFEVGEVPLDRDRGKVASFDLYWATSRAWSRASGDGVAGTVLEMLKDEVPDVMHLSHQGHGRTELFDGVCEAFVEEAGAGVVPVSSDLDLRQATSAGVRSVVVPTEMRRVLARGMSVSVAPVAGRGPADRLRALLDRVNVGDRIEAEILDELREILGLL